MGDQLLLDRPTARDLDVVGDISRREFIVGGLSLTALLAACGGDDGGTSSTVGTTAPGTRSVTGSRGPVDVPIAPSRVAALVGSADIDVMLLGLTPVFSGTYAQGWVDLPAGIATSDLVPPDPEVVAGATPGVFFAELRHLGGAVARRPEHAGAVAAASGAYLAHTVAMVPVPEAMPGADAAVRAALAALQPWEAGNLLLTFIDGGGVDRAAGFGDATSRLRELKGRYDPSNTFAAAHAL